MSKSREEIIAGLPEGVPYVEVIIYNGVIDHIHAEHGKAHVRVLEYDQNYFSDGEDMSKEEYDEMIESDGDEVHWITHSDKIL